MGVERGAVSLVFDDGLAAAVSLVSDAGCAPNAVHATAYADVIAAFSINRTVLPMRYGCLFPSATQVREFLRVRRAEFAALLAELDGCVEMGVRVLLSRTGCSAGGTAVALDGHAFPDRMAAQGRGHATARTAELGPGAAYLTARNAAYAQRDAEGEAGAATAAAIRRTFHHLSVQSRSVPAVSGQNLLVSMCFLIRRQDISAFCDQFLHLQEQGAYRLMLSGPWAPYNFVEPQELGAMG
jgi:hypothetical protein